MNITTISSVYHTALGIPSIAITTGRVYDFEQVVKCHCVASTEVDDLTMELVFEIADDSRVMYEKVAIQLFWMQIKAAQNNNPKALRMIANRIMDRYDNSNYIF